MQGQRSLAQSGKGLWRSVRGMKTRQEDPWAKPSDSIARLKDLKEPCVMPEENCILIDTLLHKGHLLTVYDILQGHTAVK